MYFTSLDICSTHFLPFSTYPLTTCNARGGRNLFHMVVKCKQLSNQGFVHLIDRFMLNEIMTVGNHGPISQFKFCDELPKMKTELLPIWPLAKITFRRLFREDEKIVSTYGCKTCMNLLTYKGLDHLF